MLIRLGRDSYKEVGTDELCRRQDVLREGHRRWGDDCLPGWPLDDL